MPESDITPDEEYELLLKGSQDSLPVAPLPPKPDLSKPFELKVDPEADAEFNQLMAQAQQPAPEAEMTVGEPEVLKTPAAPKPWYSRFMDPGSEAGSLLPRNNRAAGRGLEAPLTPESQEQLEKEKFQQASAAKSLKDMATPEGMTKKVAAQLAGPFMGAGGASIPANAANAFVQQTLQSGAEDNDRSMVENVVNGADAAAKTALLMKGGQLAATGAKNLADKSNRLLTQVFLPRPQREMVQRRQGIEGLTQLGKDARDAGLVKPRGWLDRFTPPTARRVAENAEAAMGQHGDNIAQFEDEVLSNPNVNQDVDVTGIASTLRNEAQSIQGIPDESVPGAQKTFNKVADLVSQPTDVNVKQLTPSPTREGATDVSLAPAMTERESMPLGEALKAKRYIGKQTDWQNSKLTSPETSAQNAARKFTHGGLKSGINETLSREAAAGNINPNRLQSYQDSQKKFHTAATAFDPALRLAERQNDATLGLKDLMAGAALPGGGLAALASKATTGMGPGAASSAANIGSKTLSGAGKAAAVAGQVPKINAEQRGERNNAVKDRVKSWFESLLK